MDGNGRWATRRELHRSEGHLAGVKALYDLVETCVGIGVKYMTVYAFSTENWSRPTAEVSNLMSLFAESLITYTEELKQKGIRLLAIGDLSRLPQPSLKELQRSIEYTSTNETLTLVVALSYSSRAEINHAFCEGIAHYVRQEHLKDLSLDSYLYPIEKYLDTRGIPDPDLLIRTGGEIRLSNFMLYQCAYTELYFTDTLWPDFNREGLMQAIEEYSRRERRYGALSDTSDTLPVVS